MAKKKSKPKKRHGLSKNHARRKVRDFLDFDYLSQLSDSELDFLNKFSLEYYNCRFDKPANDLHPDRKTCSRLNDSRQRDMWTQFNRLPDDFTDLVNMTDDDE